MLPDADFRALFEPAVGDEGWRSTEGARYVDAALASGRSRWESGADPQPSACARR